MAFGFGEQRILAAITGAWVTAFVLVAVYMPSALGLALLMVAALAVWFIAEFRLHWKMLSAYVVGSFFVLAAALAITLDLFVI
jgi:hypothetical protein